MDFNLLDYLPSGATALIAVILAYGVTAYIRIRKDRRDGNREKIDLFEEVRRIAADQVAQVRQDNKALRIEISSEREERNSLRRDMDALRRQFQEAEETASHSARMLDLALSHIDSMDAAAEAAGIVMPTRPKRLPRK